MNNNNNQNPKGGHNPHHNPHHKPGNGQQQPQQKQGQPTQGGQPEQKKHGWCDAHKCPKMKCNCA